MLIITNLCECISYETNCLLNYGCTVCKDSSLKKCQITEEETDAMGKDVPQQLGPVCEH